MTLSTPRANRTHIALYGKRNSGKSSLINAITRQQTSLVSHIAGTTTDPVYKAMEVQGIGPCVFIDTAGFDDTGTLGELRIEQTLRTIERTDVALMVCNDTDISRELEWAEKLKKKNIPLIWILNKADSLETAEATARSIETACGQMPLLTDALSGRGIDEIRNRLQASIPDSTTHESIVGHLVKAGDTVLLVMPQDIQAPKGRLILPQVQTIRELLDRQCLVMSCTTHSLDDMLAALARPPQLIITDSQAFHTVFGKKPDESRLTSFSVLFARHKGDIDYFIAGAKSMERLTPHSRILIAEACTHAPLSEDIGTVKIPRMLRKCFGEQLRIDHVSGNDFPEDLSPYQLIIHCGACMFNRKHVLSRVEQARLSGIPMTNYGVALAWLTGILDKIDY